MRRVFVSFGRHERGLLINCLLDLSQTCPSGQL